jgi:DNA processing protein
MARGIDSCAHQGALAGGGRTIAVLGSGVDVVYPPENRKLYVAIAAAGAIVSEYPPGTEPDSYHFPARNRIISGMSRGVLVVEASPKSGSLITARLALEQGREVFAVPGNVYSMKSKGTNNLLRSGAKLVESAQDILEELRLQGDAQQQRSLQQSGLLQGLSPELQRVFKLIPDEPVHIDALGLQAGIPVSRLSSLLLELELSGLIVQLPGKRFVKADDTQYTV